MTRWLILTVLLGLNAATCGQKGPLYRDPATRNGGVEQPSPFAAALGQVR